MTDLLNITEMILRHFTRIADMVHQDDALLKNVF